MTRHHTYRQMLARRSELSPAQESKLQQHLRQCAECRETAATYTHQTALLRSLPQVSAPASLRAGVLQGIQRGSPRRSFPLRWATPLVAAFMVALVALAYVNHHNQHPSRSALTRQTLGPYPVVRPTPVLPDTAAPYTVAPRKHQLATSTTRRNTPATSPTPAPLPVPPGSGAASLAQVLPTRPPAPAFGALQQAPHSVNAAATSHSHLSIKSATNTPHRAAPRRAAPKHTSPAPIPSPLPVAPVSAGSRTKPTPAPTAPVIVLHIRPTPAPAQPPPAYPTPPPAPASRPTPVAAAPAYHPASPSPTPTPPS